MLLACSYAMAAMGLQHRTSVHAMQQAAAPLPGVLLSGAGVKGRYSSRWLPKHAANHKTSNVTACGAKLDPMSAAAGVIGAGPSVCIWKSALMPLRAPRRRKRRTRCNGCPITKVLGGICGPSHRPARAAYTLPGPHMLVILSTFAFRLTPCGRSAGSGEPATAYTTAGQLLLGLLGCVIIPVACDSLQSCCQQHGRDRTTKQESAGTLQWLLHGVWPCSSHGSPPGRRCHLCSLSAGLLTELRGVVLVTGCKAK